MTSLWGPFVTTWTIEEAVLETLKVWMNETLAELERQTGVPRKTIPRPTAACFHGGSDPERYEGQNNPEVIVVVKPEGEPTARGQGAYTQEYHLEVYCVYVGQSGSILAENIEDEARAVASYLGAATMVLVQKPALGGLCQRLIMTGSPDVTMPEAENRKIALCTTTFSMWVENIVEEKAGPLQPLPKESPEFEGVEEPWNKEPTVSKATTTVKAEPLKEPL